MLHGKGNQIWYTKEYESDRIDAMLDRTKFTDDELEALEVEFPQGGGRTNPESFVIKQNPFPTMAKIRRKKNIDVRDVVPKIGN